MGTELTAFSKSTCLLVNILLLYLIAITVDITQCAAEYLSSVNSPHRVIDVEMKLVKALEQHIEDKKRDLVNFRSFLDYVEAEHELIQADAEDYLGNPLNAFTLMKRMVNDWKLLDKNENKRRLNNAFTQTLDTLQSEGALPDVRELRNAVRGLARLQKIYNLKASDLAKGVINGFDYNSKLDSQNCLNIAISLLVDHEPFLAIGWFKMTLKLLNKERVHSTQRLFEIKSLDFLAFLSSELGFEQKATQYINRIHKITPNYNSEEKQFALKSRFGSAIEQFKQLNVDNGPIFSNYTRLCNGIQLPEKVHHKLKCTLETRNNPVFILAPLKTEEVNIDPEITIYHNFLSDADVEFISSKSERNVNHSILESKTEKLDASDSQTVWLKTVSKIYALLGHLTELNMSSSDGMKVSRYGIGGFYEPHCNFWEEKSSAILTAQRLSTNLFFLSDVEQGGFLVFPKINVYLRPEKGSLVTWYNLHKSLTWDYRTLHAGCPVIKGSKSVGVTWISSRFQEFRRPCGLKNDDYKNKHYFSSD